MRYTLKEIPHLLANPAGRHELLVGQRHNLYPVLRMMAAFYRRSFLRRTRFYTVAGSLGKSTTMRSVAAALGQPVPHLPPTNSWSGLALSILSVRPGTPYRVLEAGISSPGHMREYARMIRPDVTVITSIAREHHRSLGTLEDIRFEKANIIRCQKANGFAILNGDDPNVLWMAGQTPARVITFGFGIGNNIRADDFEINWPRGNRFTLYVEGVARIIQTKLCGRHMVYPILAGVAAGLTAQRDLEQTICGLERLHPTPGRMQIVGLDGGVTILRDDYKGTLETVYSALESLSHIPAHRLFIVLGEVEDAPGSLGPIQRKIGGLLARYASKAIILCSSNNFQPLRSGALSAGMPDGAVIHAGRDWSKAQQLFECDLSTGDVVLVKGRRTQRLERIVLSLQGKSVRCRIPECKSSIKACSQCPMLDKG
jgi:UDP-N-acetylmuramyl pentapeptide synthase